MSVQDTVEGILDALENGDFAEVRTYLSSDFQFIGAEMGPLNRDEWLGLSAGLKAAFPDFSYNFIIEDINGNEATVSVQMTGTHTGDWDLSAMGIGVVPATGIAFSARRSDSVGIVENDLIVEISVDPSPDTGVPAIMQQLGIQPPG